MGAYRIPCGLQLGVLNGQMKISELIILFFNNKKNLSSLSFECAQDKLSLLYN